MQITMRIIKKELHITATGKICTGDEINSYTALVLDKAFENDIKRILIEQSALTNTTTALEAAILADSEKINEAVKRGIRVASVISPKEYNICMVYENALFNRSLNFKTFIDADSARRWLSS